MNVNNIMNKRTIVVAFMAVCTLAICFVILGSVSVELMGHLGINEGKFGSLVMSLFLTSCIVQIFIGPLVDKFGYKPIAIIGFAITAVSMFLLAFALNYGITMLACILLGVGAMCLNTVGNTLIPVLLFEGKDPARASNFGNIFFGLGFVLTPLFITLFLNTMSYSAALSIFGALIVIFLIFSLIANYPQVSSGFKFSMVFKLLKKSSVLIAALALFFYLSLETTMATWTKPLMTELFGGGVNAASNAGLILSLFGVAMIIGRLISSRIKSLTAIGGKVIIIMSLVSLVSIILVILTKNPILAVFGVFVTGLAFGPIFPNIVGITFAKFDKSLYGSIFGIIFAIGLLGSTLVPKFIGNLSAGDASVQESLLIAAVMAGILFIIAFFLGKKGKAESSE